MAARLKLWAKVVLLLGAGFGAWKLWHRFFDEDQATRNLVNQIWIERMPKDERDLVHVGVLVQREGRRVGVVARASRWRAFQDAFVWRLDKDMLRTRFPQDDKRYSLRARTWECEGEAPRPFQLCLELARGERKLRFYSMKDWVVRPRADGPLPRDIAPLAPDWESPLEAAQLQELGEGPDAAGASPFDSAP
jgi:hypothetical protein